jgi:hypothetical protein
MRSRPVFADVFAKEPGSTSVVGIRGLALIERPLGSHQALFHNPHLMEQPDRVDPALDSAGLSEGDFRGLLFVSPETENDLVGYSEPLRRFIQHEGFTPQVNEIANDMPSWIPGEDHLINFQKGDPFVKVDEGYARLPPGLSRISQCLRCSRHRRLVREPARIVVVYDGRETPQRFAHRIVASTE